MDRNTSTCSIRELGLKHLAKVDGELFSCLHPIKMELGSIFFKNCSTHSEVVSA